MEVKKGDKVLFEICDKPLKNEVGVVKFVQDGYPFVDLLCEGDSMDYRADIDQIKRIYGNVFKAELGA